jgi:hypothetical protein
VTCNKSLEFLKLPFVEAENKSKKNILCDIADVGGAKRGDTQKALKRHSHATRLANCPFLLNQRLDSLTRRARAKKGRAPHTNGQGPIPSSNNSPAPENAAEHKTPPTFTSRRSNFSSSFLHGAKSGAAPSRQPCKCNRFKLNFGRSFCVTQKAH